jgi:tetratricopeptide (TPR) repeat protein
VLRDQFVPGLERLRLQALEDRAEAELRLGRPDWLIPQLRDLVAQYPMRERFHGQLMEALALAGRQAEALEVYRHARQVLVDELGIEPGQRLQLLHQQILDGDPQLAAPAAGRAASPPAPETGSVGNSTGAVPRQLPGAVPHFTGRSAELARLSKVLDQAGGQAPGTVVISAIGGTAGVGKTALAVHWAHRVASRFPDGQLYLNLRGYDPSEPVSAADALAVLLRSLGLAGADIPADQDERAAKYRSLLAGRRALLLLDNASGAEQVRPLLPATPGCLTLVTSRDSLAGLVARDGARRLDLDLLPPAAAVELLRTLVGDRVDAEPAAAMELAERCSRLPLALRIAAELAAARPQASLSALASELAGQRGGLDLLDAGGDSGTAVRAVFSWSYQYLDADAGRGFQLISLHPGTEVDGYAVAALTGSTLRRSEQILDQLARAHLIRPVTARSYSMHDLLRAYASDLAAAQLSEASRHAALTALLDSYLHTASLVKDVLHPDSKHPPQPEAPLSASPAPPIRDHASARVWLDAHRAALVAVITYAADHDWPGHAATLATTVFRDLESGGHYPELLTIYQHVLPAARRAGDGAAEAEALNNVCVVYLRQGDYPAASCHLERALVLCRERGDLTGQAWAHGNFGILDFLQGRYQQATDHQSQAIELYARTGDHIGEIRSLLNLSLVELRQGHYEQAARHAELAVTDARPTKAHGIEADALVSLGRVELRQGCLTLAAAHLNHGLEIHSERGDPTGQADALTGLGALERELGNCRQAAEYHLRALDLSRQTGNKCGQAEALNGLGESQLSSRLPDQARTDHAAALELANQIGDLYEQARAHRGLSRAHGADGRAPEASHHWQEAAKRYAELGAAEAADEEPSEFDLAGSI